MMGLQKIFSMQQSYGKTLGRPLRFMAARLSFKELNFDKYKK
jgi:hypothetical protein